MASGPDNPCLTVIYAYQESAYESDFQLDAYIEFEPKDGQNSWRHCHKTCTKAAVILGQDCVQSQLQLCTSCFRYVQKRQDSSARFFGKLPKGGVFAQTALKEAYRIKLFRTVVNDLPELPVSRARSSSPTRVSREQRRQTSGGSQQRQAASRDTSLRSRGRSRERSRVRSTERGARRDIPPRARSHSRGRGSGQRRRSYSPIARYHRDSAGKKVFLPRQSPPRRNPSRSRSSGRDKERSRERSRPRRWATSRSPHPGSPVLQQQPAQQQETEPAPTTAQQRAEEEQQRAQKRQQKEKERATVVAFFAAERTLQDAKERGSV
jgi:hypothetical protein